MKRFIHLILLLGFLTIFLGCKKYSIELNRKFTTMNQSILTAFIFCSLISFGQQEVKDSSRAIHFIYIVPTSLFGNLRFDLSNVWIEMGYGYKYKKSMYSFGASAIVHSTPRSGAALIWPGISSIRSDGFSTSVEYKRVFVKRFYCGFQLNDEHIETVRPESYMDEFNQQMTSQYKVFRNEIAFIPRIGFVFVNRNELSCDINIGTGIRYIWSRNSGKMNSEGNNQKESFTDKTFDSGHKFAQRLSIQFRVGYSF